MTDLPPSWELVPLRDLGVWYGGGTPSKSRADYWENGSIPWLSPKDMGAEIITETRDYITQMATEKSSARLVPAGSVAIVVRSGILERKLPIGLVPFATTLNQDIKALVPFGGIDARWVAWGLRSLEQDILRHYRKAGTTVASIEIPRLMELRFPVPPLAEQRRIVATLEGLLSHLDTGLNVLRISDRRLAILAKRIIVESVPLPGPDHWKLTTVAHAGKVELGRQRHPDWHTGPNMRPYLRVANVFEDRIDSSNLMEMDFPPEIFERFRLTKGDILLNEGQSPEYLGRPAMYRGSPPNVAFTNSLLRFRANPDVLPEWALLVFRRHMHAGRFIKEVRITTNIAHLSASRLASVEFPIPPLKEQEEIVANVRNQLDQLARMSAAVVSGTTRSEQLRQALLAEAFAGRLVPQDPNDEPAWVLLERIRVERAAATSPGRRRGNRTKSKPGRAKTATDGGAGGGGSRTRPMNERERETVE